MHCQKLAFECDRCLAVADCPRGALKAKFIQDGVCSGGDIRKHAAGRRIRTYRVVQL